MGKNVLQDAFVDGGVYVLHNMPSNTNVFLCQSVSGGIGKLIQYSTDGNGRAPDAVWEKTGVQYFLNSYDMGSIKSLFLNRENYDMLGLVGNNFFLSEDEDCTYLIRSKA